MSDKTSGTSRDLTPPKGSREEPEVEDAFDRMVGEGEDRLSRPLLSLVAVGLLAGVDVGVGVLIYLAVDAKTGQPLLASLAFTVGFVALLMARSELFTENFLVPVAAVIAKVGSLSQLIRLWVVTLVANLAAGALMAWITVTALPEVKKSATTAASTTPISECRCARSCSPCSAARSSPCSPGCSTPPDSLGVKIVPAVMMSFVLVGAQLFHSVLDSILMLAGLFSGANSYGYADAAAGLGWAVFGNIVGGVVLVTSVRLLRVPHRVQESREDNS